MQGAGRRALLRRGVFGEACGKIESAAQAQPNNARAGQAGRAGGRAAPRCAGCKVWQKPSGQVRQTARLHARDVRASRPEAQGDRPPGSMPCCRSQLAPCSSALGGRSLNETCSEPPPCYAGSTPTRPRVVAPRRRRRMQGNRARGELRAAARQRPRRPSDHAETDDIGWRGALAQPARSMKASGGLGIAAKPWGDRAARARPCCIHSARCS